MKHFSTPSAFKFKRPDQDGPVLVFNENSYLMGEYHPRIGKTIWQRVVPITQREQVERWLVEHYPSAEPAAAKVTEVPRKRNLPKSLNA